LSSTAPVDVERARRAGLRWETGAEMDDAALEEALARARPATGRSRRLPHMDDSCSATVLRAMPQATAR